MSEAGNLLKKGGILFMQGEMPGEIFMLQSGALEILGAGEEFTGLQPDELLAKSVRIGMIKGKTLIVGFSELLNKPYANTLRAVEDSYFTKFTLTQGGFKGIAASDPVQAVTVIKQLYGRYTGLLADIEKIENLRKNITRLNDNFSLIYKELSVSEILDKLDDRSNDIHKSFAANGGTIPRSIGAKFLVTDNSAFFDRVASDADKGIEAALKSDFSDFIKKFIRLDQNILTAAVKADPMIAVDIFRAISKDISFIIKRIYSLNEYVDNILSDIFCDDVSWAVYMVENGGYHEWELTGRIEPDFLKNFLTIIVKINGVYEEISGKKLSDDFPGVKKIHAYYSSRMNESGAESHAGKMGEGDDPSRQAAPKSIPAELKKSINQIFEFAMIDKEFQNQFIKALNEFKTMKSPFNTETDGRKIRRHITKMYWDLYKQVYIRMKADSSPPMPARLMISFGFLDEKLLEESQVAELTELIKRKEDAKIIPVMNEYEFLSLINAGGETPSITEMGLTYAAQLKEEEKHSKKQEVNKGVVDENLKMTLYEIEQRLRSTAAVCSGSTATAFPILNSMMIKGTLTSLYTSKRNVEKTVQDLRDIDFSVFWRETVLKIGEAREIIREEVVPYFVILPIYGTRTLLWQELTGVDKRSRGRIMVPAFFMGDLQKHLAHSLACFRWELNRSIKGQAMWADPIEGGITGEYFDYVNTFKKMSNLSMEAKEKIASRFKALRTNRDRFADDYLSWIFYEKEGIMKLNSVVRGIFFKYMPFKKQLRDKLEIMPAFSQVATRYKNVSVKTYKSFESRFKKYMDEDGKYLDGIQEYMDFMKY